MNIDKITTEIINFANIDNLSWMQVFKKIITKYDNYSTEEKNKILLSVIHTLSKKGYDIQDNPFKLIKF